MLVHTSKSSIWEIQAGRSGVKSLLQLHRELKASLGYTRPCLKMETKLAMVAHNFNSSTQETEANRLAWSTQ